ncbi:MAG: hypothetical protein LBT31_04845 [Synergistaceae bacterium]|nr:hypothetical protein [Synergistaceae bacterium]
MDGNIEEIALYQEGISGNIGYYLVILNIVNTNLDLGLPVGVGFTAYPRGTVLPNDDAIVLAHSAVIDGYGFATLAQNPQAINPKIDYAMPYSLTSPLPVSQHSMIDTVGTSKILSTGTYIFRDLVVTQWGADYEITSEVIPT